MKLSSPSIFPRPVLAFLTAALSVSLMNASVAVAATATNAAPPVVASTNTVSTPVAAPVQKKTGDDEIDDDSHSFKLNINTNHDDKPQSLTAQFLDNLIPLAGIAGSFGTPILIVFFVCYFNYRRRRENVALAREYLAKGLPVPPELLDPALKGSGGWGSKGGGAGNDIRRGFRLTFIGLAVTAAFYVDNPHSTTWGWGLIPTIMGLGFLLSGWFEGRREGRPTYPLDRQFPPGDQR